MRGGPEAIASRQQARVADLVTTAQACSPYFRTRYRHLPARVTDARQLPPVTKPEMMAHFDDWVTDPAVTRAGVEAFVADKSLIGQPYLGRYMVWTTSGTSGVPAMVVADPGWQP
jgi:phenylacetate-CoA ligase